MGELGNLDGDPGDPGAASNEMRDISLLGLLQYSHTPAPTYCLCGMSRPRALSPASSVVDESSKKGLVDTYFLFLCFYGSTTGTVPYDGLKVSNVKLKYK